MPAPKSYKEKKVYYSPAEWKIICERAEKLSMRPGTYIKIISVQGEIKEYNLADAIDLTTAINRIGRNINQISRVDNECSRIYKKDIELMQADVNKMKKEIEYYLSPLNYEILI